jgi:hypothetical protein
MTKQNTLNPICPRCRSRLRRNGFKNGKLRLRCRCGYNDTENSTAHNANKRLLIHNYFDMLTRERKGKPFHTYPSYTQLKERSVLEKRSNFVALTRNNCVAGSNTKAKPYSVKDSGNNPNTTLDRDRAQFT